MTMPSLSEARISSENPLGRFICGPIALEANEDMLEVKGKKVSRLQLSPALT
jgi:hypothetical protein